MTSDTAGRKRPWLAALLTVLAPGLGHAYLRQWSRALLWLLLVVGSWFVLMPEMLTVDSLAEFSALTDNASMLVNVALAGISVLCIVDAYWMATHQNRQSAARSHPLAGTGSSSGAGSDSGQETATEAGDGAPDGPVVECPHCGKALDAELDFCHWCTTPLDSNG